MPPPLGGEDHGDYTVPSLGEDTAVRSMVSTLVLGTANVCTMDSRGQRRAERAGLAVSGRGAILEKQFFKGKYDIVGVQESRLQGNLPRDGEHYSMFASSANKKGDLGVQCWVGRRLTSQVADVRPISPRLLGLVLSLGDVRVVILVGHAPHSFDTPAARDLFYDAMDALIDAYRRRYRGAMRLLLLGDFNGRVGSVASPSVGPWAPEIENDGGMRLRQFAEAHQLCLASTFCGRGVATTWVDGYGGQHRIDYVICDADLLDGAQTSWVDDDIDLATAAKEDHRVVGLRMTIVHDDKKLPASPQKRRWAACLLEDPVAQEAFQRHIYMAPWP